MSEDKKAPRQCLYSAGGYQIFEGQEAIEAAIEDGFVDHPDKVEGAATAPAAEGVTMDNSKPEIIAFAINRGLDLDDNLTKAGLLEAIDEAA